MNKLYDFQNNRDIQNPFACNVKGIKNKLWRSFNAS